MGKARRKARILLAKSQIDCHDRGLRYVARKMQEAGFEVIFIRYAVSDEIVAAALEEDADVIGISFSSGNPMLVVPKVMHLMKVRGIREKPVMVGGIVADDIVPELLGTGVTGIFGPGSDPGEIIRSIEQATGEDGMERGEAAGERLGEGCE